MLNSPVAVHTSIQVVRAFIRLREAATSLRELARELDALEKKYDAQMEPPPPRPKNRIGFRVEGDR